MYQELFKFALGFAKMKHLYKIVLYSSAIWRCIAQLPQIKWNVVKPDKDQPYIGSDIKMKLQ